MNEQQRSRLQIPPKSHFRFSWNAFVSFGRGLFLWLQGSSSEWLASLGLQIVVFNHRFFARTAWVKITSLCRRYICYFLLMAVCMPNILFSVGASNCRLLIYIIRAKRVSKCYIQEKKNCPSARVHACSTNLGFSVQKIVLVLVSGTYYVPARTAVQASCGEKHSTEWRLPTWYPQRRSPLVPSRTDSSNLHVI